MKKTAKILSIILLAIVVISTSTSVFAAAAATGLTPGEVGNSITYGDASDLQTKAGQIMGMIRNIAVIASVIIIMILGVKYMLGSVEEKAEYKKSFMPLIIGIVCVIAASSIATFIFNMVD